MTKAATMALTDVEREILRHALGLDRCRVSYRNNYSAAPKSEHYPFCMGLVANGLMERSEGYAKTLVHFWVTDAGKALVL